MLGETERPSFKDSRWVINAFASFLHCSLKASFLRGNPVSVVGVGVMGSERHQGGGGWDDSRSRVGGECLEVEPCPRPSPGHQGRTRPRPSGSSLDCNII